MRILKYALKNIVRAPFLTVSALITITLLVFFVHTLFFVRHATMILITNVVERIPITLYLNPGYNADNAEIQSFMAKIQSVSPSIWVTFRSKEEALAALSKKEPDLASIILKVDMTQENSIPNSITIEHISVDEYERVNAVVTSSKNLLQSSNLTSFSDYEYQYGKIQKLTNIITWILFIIYIVIGFFLFSIGVIIFHTIGGSVNHFREEIHIAEIVGAPRLYISGPFLLQGAILSVGSFAISSFVFFLFIHAIATLDFFQIDQYVSFFTWLVFGGVPAFILLGVLAGHVSVQKHIDRN